MKVLGVAALLALMACNGDPELKSAPSGMAPGKTGYDVRPTCPPEPVEAQPCRPTATEEIAPRYALIDEITEPPPGWRPPAISAPFGFDTPATCVEGAALPRLEDACEIDEFNAAGALIQRERRFADRLVRYDAHGNSWYERQWDAQGRTVRELDRGTLQLWQYRDDGAVLEYRRFRAGQESMIVEVRTCGGQLDQLLTPDCGAGPHHYQYDTQGRLARILQVVGAGDRVDTFTYDDAGRLRLQGFGGINSPHAHTWWDRAGRVVRHSSGGMDSDRSEYHAYGPHGVVRTYLTASNAAYNASGLTEYQYDDEGRLSLWWQTWAKTSHLGEPDEESAEAHRLTYVCGGGKVREEIDRNGDRRADREIRWSAAADGSVTETHWADGAFAGQKVYRFSCPK